MYVRLMAAGSRAVAGADGGPAAACVASDGCRTAGAVSPERAATVRKRSRVHTIPEDETGARAQVRRPDAGVDQVEDTRRSCARPTRPPSASVWPRPGASPKSATNARCSRSRTRSGRTNSGRSTPACGAGSGLPAGPGAQRPSLALRGRAQDRRPRGLRCVTTHGAAGPVGSHSRGRGRPATTSLPEPENHPLDPPAPEHGQSSGADRRPGRSPT